MKKVRCINPKNTGLKTDKIYKVVESEHFKDSYILDVGWNWIMPKDMFEVVAATTDRIMTEVDGQRTYCQKPIDFKPTLKCSTQCGLCAILEGKRQ